MAESLRERAVSAAVAVARRYGVEVPEPRVLSDRSNLLVELAPAQVVARVATSTADVRACGARDWLERDVALAGFLAAAGARVVPPATEPPAGPHTEDGLAVAFWERVAHDGSRPPSPREAGKALRKLHETLSAFAGELPPFSASNLLRTPAELLWTDFEDSCAGPIEWDLACLALSAGSAADEALDAYGRQHDEALEPFLEARRLQGAVWTALLAERQPALRARAEERLSRWAAAG